jgi:DNA-binding NarL/FixJ family response regulator
MTSTPALRSVLLVDDHPFVRDGLRAALLHSFPGLRVVEVGTASEALHALSAALPQLALLDLNLPGGNGLDLAREIRSRHRKVKVLMVAGEADPWTVSEALDAGASGFLLKTHSREALAEAVRAVLGGGTYLCPEAREALAQSEQCGPERPMPGPAILSDREREVFRFLAHGENTKTIASLLQVSPKTIETHRQHITSKLGTNSVAAWVRYALRHNLTRP